MRGIFAAGVLDAFLENPHRGFDFAVGVSAGFADTSGYVGWVPRGAFPDLDWLLFGDDERDLKPLEAGELSEPAYLTEGVYIIHLLSEPESHELANNMRSKLNAEMLRKWQNDQLTRGAEEGWLKMNFNSDLYAWVADQVAVSAPRNQPEEPR